MDEQPGVERDRGWALGRIGYELQMCVGCVARYAAADGERDQEAANAFLESLLLHARVLIDFLVP